MTADQLFDYRAPGEVSQMWLDVWSVAPEQARSAASKTALRVIETFSGEQRESLERIWECRRPSSMSRCLPLFHAALGTGVPLAAVNAVAFSAFHPAIAAVNAVLYFGNRSIGEALEERQHQRRDLTEQGEPAPWRDPAPHPVQPHTGD